MGRPAALRKSAPETVRIAGVSHDGRGIAAIDGKKVFVPDALEGEQVRILRRRRRRTYDEADLLEVLEPATSRTLPRCAAFGTCGGCSLQHVAPDEQRRIKETALRDALARIGGVAPGRWLEPLADRSPEGSWNYRRRARLAVRFVAGKDRVLVGFRERSKPFVTDMHRCEILEAPVDALIDPLSRLIGGLSIRSRLPQIEVAVADDDVELLLRVLDPPTAGDRSQLIGFGRAHGVRIALQTGGPGAVERLLPPDDERPLEYRLPAFDVRLRFDGSDFIQVNREVNRLMVSAVVELLQIEPGHRVLDLYCGIGNFSLPLARRGGAVLGIEGDARQVRRARDNARLNGLTGCEFLTADLAALSGREPWLAGHWDRLLLDPPRSGAAELLAAGRFGAPRLVYVSCHPGTLARDAGRLVGELGYRLEAAGIVDMFPHTAHVESIAVFDKIKQY